MDYLTAYVNEVEIKLSLSKLEYHWMSRPQKWTKSDFIYCSQHFARLSRNRQIPNGEMQQTAHMLQFCMEEKLLMLSLHSVGLPC